MNTMQTWESDGLQFCPIRSREQKENEKARQSEREKGKRPGRQNRFRLRMCLRFLGVCLLMTLCINAGLGGMRHWEKESRKEENTENSNGDAAFAGEKETAAQSRINVDSAVLAQKGSDEASPAVRSAKQVQGAAFDPEDPLLILVNKEHELPKDYQVALTELKSGLASVATVMYEPLMDMLEDGEKEGLHFVVCSGYRSPKRQQELLDEDIRTCMAGGMSYEEAYEEVTRFTMPPGFSEHSTGLAADIVALDYQLLDEGQEKTAENQWLRENAWKYGFILRYPADQEAVTQIDYESWHFRYVGKEAAKYMYEEKLTLEEFLGE